MPSKLDELRRRIEQTARDIDEKYDVTGKVNKGTQAATDALRKGADVVTSGIDAARNEATRINEEYKITERVSDTAKKAADKVDQTLTDTGIKKKAGEVIDDAKTTANDIFGEAKGYYETATGAAKTSVSAARLPAS